MKYIQDNWSVMLTECALLAVKAFIIWFMIWTVLWIWTDEVMKHVSAECVAQIAHLGSD